MRFSKGKLCIALHLDAFHPRAAFATSVARIQITPSSKLYLRFYPQSSLKEFVTPLQSLLLSLNSKLDLYCRTQGVVFVIFLFAFFVLYVSNFPSWWITCQKQAAATQLVRVPNSFFLTQILPMISMAVRQNICRFQPEISLSYLTFQLDNVLKKWSLPTSVASQESAILAGTYQFLSRRGTYQ